MRLRRFSAGLIVLLLVAPAVTSGCARERPSSKPPIHLIPDMDRQPKFKAQSESPFFADGAAMRTPVPGTVARGDLREDDAYYLGKNPDGSFIKVLPVSVTRPLLDRGRERFDIFCSPCHSRVGDGRGIMIKRGYVPPPTFHSERLRDIEDGYIFDVITNGVRNMPAYKYQVEEADRWAVVAYLRALQRSQNASLDDVPTELRKDLK